MRAIYFSGFLAAASAALAMNGIAATAALSGNEILARAGAASGLNSYSVPVHFDVRMHKPVGIKAGVDGIVYYKAPEQAGLKITKMPGPLASFFKTSYSIDLAPQVWPSKYNVTSTSRAESGAYVLQAVPKTPDPSIDHIVITVTESSFNPVSADWYYKDGSSVQLAIQNAPTSSYVLPHTETLAVTMPSYSLNATANYGAYNLNAPIPVDSP